MTGAAPPPKPATVSPWRLIATLGGAGAVAGFLIVFVFDATQPTIQAYRAQVLAAAIEEVLAGPDRYDTLYITGDHLTPTPPDGADPANLEQLYLGYRDDTPIGFAVVAAKPGFQDVVRLIYGYDPKQQQLLGMLVLESKETPGLGDKIVKDSSFVAEFAGVPTPITGAKGGRKDDASAPGDIDMITGATISSRTVIGAINESLGRLGTMMDDYVSGVTASAEVGKDARARLSTIGGGR